jgi:hypothetical protein
MTGERRVSTERPSDSFNHAPASTAHAFQGQTVEGVLIIDASRFWTIQQLYVVVSRVRKALQLIVLDKAPIANWRREGLKHFKARRNILHHELGLGSDAHPERPLHHNGVVVVPDISIYDDGKVVRVIEIIDTSPIDKVKSQVYEDLGIEVDRVFVNRGRVTVATGLDTSLIVDSRKTLPAKLVNGIKDCTSYWRHTLKDGHPYGRMFPECGGGFYNLVKGGDEIWVSHSAATCKSAIRRAVCSKNFVDVDMAAAAPTFVLHLGERAGLEMASMDRLVTDPKAMRAEIADELGCSLAEAKQMLNTALFGGGGAHRLVESVRGEAAAVMASLRHTDCFRMMETAAKGKRDPAISAFTNFVWTLEHDALMMAWKAIDKDQRCVFVFDCMLVPRDRSESVDTAFTAAASEAFPRLRWAI